MVGKEWMQPLTSSWKLNDSEGLVWCWTHGNRTDRKEGQAGSPQRTAQHICTHSRTATKLTSLICTTLNLSIVQFGLSSYLICFNNINICQGGIIMIVGLAGLGRKTKKRSRRFKDHSEALNDLKSKRRRKQISIKIQLCNSPILFKLLG